jgi:hypothetical protein
MYVYSVHDIYIYVSKLVTAVVNVIVNLKYGF